MLRYSRLMLMTKNSVKGFLLLAGLSLMISMPVSAQRRSDFKSCRTAQPKKENKL